MRRDRGLLVGFLAGGWLATVLVLLLPHLGIDLAGARAEDPPVAPPRQPYGPTGPTLPGPTVNPSDAPQGFRGAVNPGTGTSDSNHRAVALSASIGGGQSVVYYFDTVAQRLCVYQYTPGNRGGLSLLAARYIDFDLKLEAYRDLSEKSPREMREAWERSTGRAGSGASEGAGAGALPTREVDLPGGIR